MKYSSFCKSDVKRYLNYSRNEIKINLKTLKIDETYIYINFKVEKMFTPIEIFFIF